MRLGVHFSLTTDDATSLLAADAAGDVDAVRAKLVALEERWEADALQETDQAWDAIHRCLSAGPAGGCATLMSAAVLGGKRLRAGEGYVASFLTPAEVGRVAAALEHVQEAGMRECFFGEGLGSDYGGLRDEGDFRYTWGWFEQLRRFFRRAADQQRAIVFTTEV